MVTGIESQQADFAGVLTDIGHTIIWRRKNVTLDSVHKSPESESTPTDSNISIVTFPVSNRELGFNDSGLIERGDLVGYVKSTRDVRNDDLIIEKNESQDGNATIATSSATQAVISGDVRATYKVNDYTSISDSSNDGLYKITAVSFSSNTTLTIAFDADPGASGDTLYTTRVFKVIEVMDWYSSGDVVYKKLLLRKLS